MGAQLDLLEYVAPLRVCATTFGDRLHVRATGADREATLNALVEVINALDREGYPALHLFGGAGAWPPRAIAGDLPLEAAPSKPAGSRARGGIGCVLVGGARWSVIPRPGAFMGCGPVRPAPRAAVRVTRLPEPAPAPPPAPHAAVPPHPSLQRIAALARALEGAATRASVSPTAADLDVICDALDALDGEAARRLSDLRAELSVSIPIPRGPAHSTGSSLATRASCGGPRG